MLKTFWSRSFWSRGAMAQAVNLMRSSLSFGVGIGSWILVRGAAILVKAIAVWVAILMADEAFLNDGFGFRSFEAKIRLLVFDV